MCLGKRPPEQATSTWAGDHQGGELVHDGVEVWAPPSTVVDGQGDEDLCCRGL